MNYDFSQLNDKEFEILSTDLLSKELGERIERFKSGKDAGVDGRFFSNNGKEIIIQYKHYLKSGYRQLISTAKEEIDKLHMLKPQRYIFVTSLPLSRSNKQELKKIFSPYIKSSSDVFGQEDLNGILSQNSKIEEKHFKLWIASTNVLTRLINNAIKGRSEFEIERIRKNAKKYFVTKNHDEALKILNQNNVLIISGEPGIGKTTLAENICLHYVANDYTFVDIEEELGEAEQVYKKGEKQIFYFDDFLGSNYFEAIENKKDSHIVKFIDRVKNDNLKKFILTSRTNILNSGIIHSNIFDNKNIRKNEYLLSIQNLTELEKAHILYNHIWFSGLNNEFVDELYKDKRYKKIIKHKNFNPRLIEFITDVDRIDVPANTYWEFVEETLGDPKNIWSNSFKIQSNSHIRNLVLLTVLNGGKILEDDLRTSFYEINSLENLGNTSHTEKDFLLTSQMAVRSFLNRASTFWGISFSLFNPSIADFVLHQYGDNLSKLTAMYECLNTLESLETFISLKKEKLISADHESKILDELFFYSFKKGKQVDYLIFISYLLADDLSKREQITALLQKIIFSPEPIREFSKFINLLSKFRQDLEIEHLEFLVGTFTQRSLGYFDLTSLINFLHYFSNIDQNILDAIAEQVESYLSSEIDQIIYDNVDLSNHVLYEYEDSDTKIELDVSSLFDEIKICLKQNVDNLFSDNSNLLKQVDLDFDNILSAIDMDKLRQEYENSLKENEEQKGNFDYSGVGFENDIDDLFERN